MESQSVFTLCGGLPVETTSHICFKLAFLCMGALQPQEQRRMTAVLFSWYPWPGRTALSYHSDLSSSIPMLRCETDSEARWVFTSLGCSGEVPLTPWKQFTPAEIKELRDVLVVLSFMWSWCLGTLSKPLFDSFQEVLSFVSGSPCLQYFSFLCKVNPKAHCSPWQDSYRSVWILDICTTNSQA